MSPDSVHLVDRHPSSKENTGGGSQVPDIESRTGHLDEGRAAPGDQKDDLVFGLIDEFQKAAAGCDARLVWRGMSCDDEFDSGGCGFSVVGYCSRGRLV